jgi:hypothetical protein
MLGIFAQLAECFFANVMFTHQGAHIGAT